MLEAALPYITQPTPQAERLGVYVLAAIVGLLVSGAVTVIKELRAEAAGKP